MTERSRSRRQHTTEPAASSAKGPLEISRTRRAIRTSAPTFRWECPCQEPPVLLATYDPQGRVNIKVRDRYWHLYGFGQVHAICPRCAAEHILDLCQLFDALHPDSAGDDDPAAP